MCSAESDRGVTYMRRAVLILTCLCSFGSAQSSGVLVGIIMTRSGQPARNTRIVLLSLTDGTRRNTTTDDLGIYACSLLPQAPMSWSLQIGLPCSHVCARLCYRRAKSGRGVFFGLI